ncbi:hypothetical protein [Streptomyces sp. NPDC003943]
MGDSGAAAGRPGRSRPSPAGRPASAAVSLGAGGSEGSAGSDDSAGSADSVGSDCSAGLGEPEGTAEPLGAGAGETVAEGLAEGVVEPPPAEGGGGVRVAAGADVLTGAEVLAVLAEVAGVASAPYAAWTATGTAHAVKQQARAGASTRVLVARSPGATG